MMQTTATLEQRHMEAINRCKNDGDEKMDAGTGGMEEKLKAIRLVLVLLDIKKAYPNVCRRRCGKTLARECVPTSMLAVVKMLHCTTQYNVVTKIDDSELFELRR